MAARKLSPLGGESLYCVNLTRLNQANQMVYDDPRTAPRMQAHLHRLELELDQDERAAIAMVLIDRLLRDLP
jgi:hypothetical protein